MDSVTVLGNIALVCTIASNFSGLPICMSFFKKRSTTNASVIPFLAGTTCTSLWLQYSILMGDGMLKTVNAIAVFMQTFYVACFYINTKEKAKVQKLSSLVFTFLLTIYIYGFCITHKEAAKTILGLAASAFSILACASPFVSLADVIKTRNSQTLPFPIISSTFVVTTLWFFYGILVEDAFIQVPNFIGAILSVIQLILIAIFPAKEDKDASLKKD